MAIGYKYDDHLVVKPREMMLGLDAQSPSVNLALVLPPVAIIVAGLIVVANMSF